MKTHSTILNKDFDFSVNHLGLFINDDLYIQDRYIIFINGYDFKYFQGIAHREERKIFNNGMIFKELLIMNPKKTKENMILYKENIEKCSIVKPLKIDDVLNCLVLDYLVSRDDFDDFCANFGYNEDSIKALEIYNNCRKNAKKLKNIIDDLDNAADKFNNY